MLDDCNYNKVRLLHDLSRMANFLKKHAKRDAGKGKHHGGCSKLYLELERDLETHIKELGGAVAELAKKGKFNWLGK